ncbi:MAG: histidinol dehydrogenase, partial [Ferruginibacter sp.]
EKSQWLPLTQRANINHTLLETTVTEILSAVKTNGDVAVKKYTALFDGAELNAFAVSPNEMFNAIQQVDEDLKTAIVLAAKNIEAFHQSQLNNEKAIETMPGIQCWRKSIGIEKVGLYIPGGTAPLFSTVLMLAIPAKLAGCKEIILCTPPDADAKINAVILFTASLCGISKIYKVGGVQAIGAMAYGTETIPKVYKIFGPGNQYVTCAKQLINKEGIAIDMPAGPSELAIYADETATPAYVAADLLSQAEHGTDSQVILVASNEKIIQQVQEEVQKQLTALPRHLIAAKALENSRNIVFDSPNKAFDFLNAYAPEHLIIASDNAHELGNNVVNAGSVFLGHYSPESVGDYASGTNHTLPTNGYATAYSGVSVDSFVKKITYQQLSENGLKAIGKTVEIMAAAEGLHAHKNAVTIRLNSFDKA